MGRPAQALATAQGIAMTLAEALMLAAAQLSPVESTLRVASK
jgi:hypothetical protein